jgi:hypothetical protein
MSLEPDRDQIEIYVDALFRHAQNGFVSLRAFVEGSNDVFRITPIKIVRNNLKFLCDAAEDDARRAAQSPKPAVFCPPLCAFSNAKTAAENDVVEGFTITVECDENPEDARAKLESILGPATVVVRSGGIWSNGNGVTQDKLHLHWRVATPTRSKDEHTQLKRAREICAHLVNADPTSIPICHPIRWAGSWHRKNNPRLTEIVACNPDIEIKLDEALALLEPLAPTPPPTSNHAAQPGEDPEAEPKHIATALAVIPNDCNWKSWNDIGMATWRATGGAAEGFAAFDAWSKKPSKYNARNTAERWAHYFESPPTLIGAGTIFHLADQAEPDWRHQWDRNRPYTHVWHSKDFDFSCTPTGLKHRDKDGRVYVQVTTPDGNSSFVPEDELEPIGGTQQVPGAGTQQQQGPGAGGPGQQQSGATSKGTQHVWRDPTTIPPRDFLYDNHIIRHYVTGDVSMGGVGKTSEIQVEIAAMVTGRDLLGVKPKRQYRVWYINLEDPQEEIDRRFAAIFKHYGIVEKDLGNRLFTDSGRTKDFVVARERGNAGIKFEKQVIDEIEDTIHKNGIDLVVIDPFVNSARFAENDNSVMAAIIEGVWAAIAERQKCAVKLEHHVRKGGAGHNGYTVEDARGGGALINSCRMIRVFNTMTKEEGEKADVDPQHRSYFRIDSGKINLAPPPEDSEWRKFVSIPLGNAAGDCPEDKIGVVTAWKWPDPTRNLTVSDLRAAQKAVSQGGPWKKDVQAKDWVGKPIAEALNLDVNDKFDKTTIKGALKIWVKNRMFKVVDGWDAKKRRKCEFVEVGIRA